MTASTFKQRRRGGLPIMSGRMLTILQSLRAAKAEGFPFMALEGVHPRTLRAMQNFDWIFVSKGHDGVRYCITGRGLKALAVYEAPPRRFDGMCPDCGTRPKALTKNGKRLGYCKDCASTHSLRQYHLKGRQMDASKPCSTCGIRPRIVYRDGAIPYCAECRRAMRRAERDAKRQRRLAAIAAGNSPVCCAKDCTAPVYHTKHSVYDYCYAHYRERQLRWQKAWKLRQTLQSKGV